MDLEEQGFLTQPAMGTICPAIICRLFLIIHLDFLIERLRHDQSRPKTVETAAITNNSNEDASNDGVDGFESKAGDSIQDEAVMSHASSRVSSVASLLALKRGKLESMRKATINAANEFAQSSKKDSMVNSMRTLTMIQSRVPGIKTMSHE